MNEIRRAGLEQVAITIEGLLRQLTALLDAETQDVKDLPDNIEDSDFATQLLKVPMFELAAARMVLVEVGHHIAAATAKAER